MMNLSTFAISQTVTLSLLIVLVIVVIVLIVIVAKSLKSDKTNKANKEILHVEKTSEVIIRPDTIRTQEVELDPELVLLKREGDEARNRIKELEQKLADFNSNINAAKTTQATQSMNNQVSIFESKKKDTQKEIRAEEKRIAQNIVDQNKRKEEAKKALARTKNDDQIQGRIVHRQHIRTQTFNQIMEVLETHHMQLHWFLVMKSVIGIDSAMTTQYNFDNRFVNVYMLRIKYVIENFLNWNETRKRIVMQEIEKAISESNWTSFTKTVNKWFASHIKFIDTPRKELHGIVEVDFYQGKFAEKQKFVNDYIWFIGLNYLGWDKKRIHKYVHDVFDLKEDKMIETVNADFGKYFVLAFKEVARAYGK